MPPEPTDPGFSMTLDGRTYTVRLSELTGIDAKDFRAEVGVPLSVVFRDPAALDLDVLAGLVWLVRRRLDRRLSYAQVASSLRYDTEIVFEAAGGPPPATLDDPEA
jgi:hypothetical protein